MERTRTRWLCLLRAIAAVLVVGPHVPAQEEPEVQKLRIDASLVCDAQGLIGELRPHGSEPGRVVLACENGVVEIATEPFEIVRWTPFDGSTEEWMEGTLRQVRFVSRGSDRPPGIVRFSDFGFGPIELFDDSGARVWGLTVEESDDLTVLVADLDLDGDEEIVLVRSGRESIEVRDHAGNLQARASVPAVRRQMLVVADLHPDEGLEFAYRSNASLVLLDRRGVELARTPCPEGAFVNVLTVVQERLDRQVVSRTLVVGASRREVSGDHTQEWYVLVRSSNGDLSLQRREFVSTEFTEGRFRVHESWAAMTDTHFEQLPVAGMRWTGVEVWAWDSQARSAFSAALDGTAFGDGFAAPRTAAPTPLILEVSADNRPTVVAAVGNTVVRLR